MMCETELCEYKKRVEVAAPVEDCAVQMATSLSALQDVVNNLKEVEHASIMKQLMEKLNSQTRKHVDSVPSPQWRSHHVALTAALSELVAAAHRCPAVFVHARGLPK